MIIFITNRLHERPIANSAEEARLAWNYNANFRALSGSNASGKEGNDAVISKDNCDRTAQIYFVHAHFFHRLQNGIRGA